jgi:putative ABC transport system permease protein
MRPLPSRIIATPEEKRMSPKGLRLRLRTFFRKNQTDREMEAELRFHLERQIEDNIKRGMSPKNACYEALRSFGGIERVKEECRDARGLRWLDRLWQDLSYAARMLRKSPGFTAVAIITLALGIGANTAIFSLVNAVLWRPVSGIKEPDRLVQVGGSSGTNSWNMNVSYPNYKDWRDQNQVFSHLAAYKNITLSLSADDASEGVAGAMVSANYFEALGVRAFAGRTFLPEEDLIPGSCPVAILSYGFWKRGFGADPGLIGKTIGIHRRPFTVVGVVPNGFGGTQVGRPVEVWVPIMMAAEVWTGGGKFLGERSWSLIQVIGRLRPGIGVRQAHANMDAVARNLEAAYPDENQRLGVSLDPHMGLYPFERTKIVGFGAILMAVVVLVLMIACSNVANLFLARATTRQREIAVRLAMGASRARLIHQLLVENISLALIGGTVGVLGAICTGDLFSQMAISTGLFPSADYALDYGVLCFATFLSLSTGMVIGLVPAFQSSKMDPMPALKEAAPAPARRLGPRNLLVVSQISLSLVLLAVAGLLVSTLRSYVTVDPGFEMKNVLSVSFDLGAEGYSEAEGRLFYARLLELVRTTPGVRCAGLADAAPIAGGSSMTTIFDYGRGPVRGLFDLPLKFTAISSGYLQTLGIPLVRGRDFSDQDGPGTPSVAIINETMANRLWPGENPVGKRFETTMGRRGKSAGQVFTIIGVARDTRDRLWQVPGMGMYLPLSQQYAASTTLLVSATADPLSLVAAIKREVHVLDKNLPISDIGRLRDSVRNTLRLLDASAAIIGFFAIVALVLATIGIYGVISYSVARQTHEIGIRMALGGESKHVLLLVMRRGLVLAFAGVTIGALGAFWATRFLSRFSAGQIVLPAADLAAFLATPALLLFFVVLAIYIPARRATKLDPVAALRRE